ncbi:MAG: carbonic anhydrase [Tepidiformaceae bacterium]
MILDDLIAHNEEYAKSYSPLDPLVVPVPRVALVLCKDGRIDPVAAFGLAAGEAHVIRNGGGRLADAVRSLAISQTQLGPREVAIIHHTQCGMMTFHDDELRETLRKDLGADASGVAFLSFTDLEQSVRDDLQLYRSQQLLRQDIPVRGFVYELETGRLREVQRRES